MEIDEYNNLMNEYLDSSIKICIEKCCGYKFMFSLNKRSTLADLYKYVILYYSHITEPLFLYEDSDFSKMMPNNNILLENYLQNRNIRSHTNMNLPVVYKFYLDLCSEHKRIYNQNYLNN